MDACGFLLFCYLLFLTVSPYQKSIVENVNSVLKRNTDYIVLLRPQNGTYKSDDIRKDGLHDQPVG